MTFRFQIEAATPADREERLFSLIDRAGWRSLSWHRRPGVGVTLMRFKSFGIATLLLSFTLVAPALAQHEDHKGRCALRDTSGFCQGWDPPNLTIHVRHHYKKWASNRHRNRYGERWGAHTLRLRRSYAMADVVGGTIAVRAACPCYASCYGSRDRFGYDSAWNDSRD